MIPNADVNVSGLVHFLCKPREKLLVTGLAWESTEHDVALLWLDVAPDESASRSPIWWGEYDRSVPVEGQSCGFPDASALRTGNTVLRDSRGFFGDLDPFSYIVQGRLAFDIRRPELVPEARELLSGLSGAPLFVSDCLVGVVTQVSSGAVKSVDVAPVAQMLSDDAFRALVDQSDRPVVNVPLKRSLDEEVRATKRRVWSQNGLVAAFQSAIALSALLRSGAPVARLLVGATCVLSVLASAALALAAHHHFRKLIHLFVSAHFGKPEEGPMTMDELVERAAGPTDERRPLSQLRTEIATLGAMLPDLRALHIVSVAAFLLGSAPGLGAIAWIANTDPHDEAKPGDGDSSGGAPVRVISDAVAFTEVPYWVTEPTPQHIGASARLAVVEPVRPRRQTDRPPVVRRGSGGGTGAAKTTGNERVVFDESEDLGSSVAPDETIVDAGAPSPDEDLPLAASAITKATADVMPGAYGSCAEHDGKSCRTCTVKATFSNEAAAELSCENMKQGRLTLSFDGVITEHQGRQVLVPRDDAGLEQPMPTRGITHVGVNTGYGEIWARESAPILRGEWSRPFRRKVQLNHTGGRLYGPFKIRCTGESWYVCQCKFDGTVTVTAE